MICIFVQLDLGAISFFLALGASLYGAGALDMFVPLNTEAYRVSAVSKSTSFCRDYSQNHTRFTAGYGSVAANYVLGILLDDDRGRRVYFVMGCFLWCGNTNVCHRATATAGRVHWLWRSLLRNDGVGVLCGCIPTPHVSHRL